MAFFHFWHLRLLAILAWGIRAFWAYLGVWASVSRLLALGSPVWPFGILAVGMWHPTIASTFTCLDDPQ